jgi:hypothetical protein
MTAACKGSVDAMLAAQQVAIGENICTAKASMTIGRNFRNRRRIDQPTFPKLPLNHAVRSMSRFACPRPFGALKDGTPPAKQNSLQ